MLKKLLFVVATFIAAMGFAFAQVDVNKADQAALDGVKGLGPATSKAILDERKKGGNFRDWADFESRVKGIKDKKAAALSEAGLTINGQAKPNISAVSAKGDKNAAASVKEDKKDKASAGASAKAEPKKADKAASAQASASASAKKP